MVRIEAMNKLSRKVVLRMGTKMTNLNMYVSRCRNMTSYWKTITPRCVDLHQNKITKLFYAQALGKLAGSALLRSGIIQSYTRVALTLMFLSR